MRGSVYVLFAFEICSLPVPTRPGTRTFWQVPDPSRPEVKKPYLSDPAYYRSITIHHHPTFLDPFAIISRPYMQGPTGRGFLLRDGTGRVLAKKFGYRDVSGWVASKFYVKRA